MFAFEVLATDGAARVGRIRTSHGTLETPGFFAVATRAALKGLDPEVARRAGVQALICNAFHLAVQPGPEPVARVGGLHRFMGWPGVLATDSGGFQVFSFRHGQVADELKGRRRLPGPTGPDLEAVRVDEDGVEFRVSASGRRHRLTPEGDVELQAALGADVLFCLDECTAYHVPFRVTRDAAERNLRWARRCLERFRALGLEGDRALYGIVHGGVYPELRRRSAVAVAEMGFGGFGIGDCLGETKADWYRVVDLVCPLLPQDRPRHLLGVGEPDDLVEGAFRGIDSFDCAMPTRLARHGQALHWQLPRFRLDIGASSRLREDVPIEDGCPCSACCRFGRSYLHHLFRAREALAVTLLVEHNLTFTTRLLARVREAIRAGRLRELRGELLAAT